MLTETNAERPHGTVDQWVLRVRAVCFLSGAILVAVGRLLPYIHGADPGGASPGCWPGEFLAWDVLLADKRSR